MPHATIETESHELPKSVFSAINYLFQKLYEADGSGGYQIKEDEVRAVMKALKAGKAETDQYILLCEKAMQEWTQFNNDKIKPIPVPIP